MLFVTSRPCIQDTTLAYARYCQFDVSSYGYYRPIAGVVNFGPFGIDPSAESRPMQRGLVIHELTHALGFMYYTFNQGFIQWKWYNLTGWQHSPVKPQNILHTEYNPEIGHMVTRIVTPYTRDAVREHYGCPGLDGAELENGGGNETLLSHWEQRVFMNEYMTGTATPYPVYSNVTFSLFKDMGWYGVSPNISNLDPFLWGHKMGCEFVNGSCKNWPLTTEKEGYRCSQSTPRGQCRFDFKGWAQCNIDMPDPLDDGCLFYKSTIRTGCDVDSTVIQLTLDAGEDHSTDSHTILLIQHTADKKSRTYYDYNSFSDAMGGVCRLFETQLKENNPTARNITYDVKDLFTFIDNLPDLGILVLQKQTQSYAPHDKDWIKTKVLDHLKKMAQRN
jgi:hypothetical protein